MAWIILGHSFLMPEGASPAYPLMSSESRESSESSVKSPVEFEKDPSCKVSPAAKFQVYQDT